MKKPVILASLVFSLFLSSCAELMQVMESVEANRPLTESEIVNGLKEALIVGADSSSKKLGTADGYYKDQMVKILLPPEAEVIVHNISRLPGGQKLVDDVILRINRAAEDAAREAAPIFISSIKQMTIRDAVDILRGEDDAATQYLRRTTYQQLYELYQPKIQTSLDKEIAGGYSTNDSWNSLTGQWNKVAGSAVGRLAGLETVNTQLDDFLTRRALDGLFLKIKEEEAGIRKNPMARVSPILKRVFGSLD